ncbi:P protein-like isoform 1-T2 [Cochliomyia hominivorax]
MDVTISEDSLSLSDKPEEEAFGIKKSLKQKIFERFLNYGQQIVMLICWLIFTYFLMVNKETQYEIINIAVPAGKEGLKVAINKQGSDSSLYLRLYGAFSKNTFKFTELKSSQYESSFLTLELQELEQDNTVKSKKSVLQLQITDQDLKVEMVEKIIENILLNGGKYQLQFLSNVNYSIPLQMSYGFTMISKKTGLILGLILLCLMYIAIIFELVHRAVAGVICCSLAVGLIAAVHLRPSLLVIFIEWSNIDAIMLFFGVSILMELLAESGLQDHLAALGYEFCHGHIWPMLHCILLFSCLLSNLFDEILLVLFLAPICLRLCEIMNLNCTPVLSCLLIVINVGATLTPISTLSNNLIANSDFLPSKHIGFSEFSCHMLPATILCLLQSYIHLRLQFHNSEKMRNFEPSEVGRLKHLIKIWHRASMSMGDYTWDDSLARQMVNRRVKSLRKRLKRLGKMPQKPEGFADKVQHLKDNFPIRKLSLITICLLSLFITFILSLLSYSPILVKISKGWIALLSALLALSLTSYEDIEGILTRLDWSTMLFFMTFSIVMQVLSSLGLLESIGLLLQHCIIQVSDQQRLVVAILAVIWISAILSTFFDSVAVADMMLRIIGTLSLNQDLKLPIMPLVWSLALGCCLGDNGSLMANFSNIACAGLASRHGYRLTFLGYFKIGFFVMLGNIIVASCYLLLVHVAYKWH